MTISGNAIKILGADANRYMFAVFSQGFLGTIVGLGTYDFGFTPPIFCYGGQAMPEVRIMAYDYPDAITQEWYIWALQGSTNITWIEQTRVV